MSSILHIRMQNDDGYIHLVEAKTRERKTESLQNENENDKMHKNRADCQRIPNANAILARFIVLSAKWWSWTQKRDENKKYETESDDGKLNEKEPQNSQRHKSRSE